MTRQDILYRLACAISDLASASRLIAARIAGLDNDDVQADDVQADDVQADDVQADDVEQADDVQADDVQADDVQADDVQIEDVEQADDVVPDDVVPDDVQIEDVEQADDVVPDDVVPDDVQADDVQADDVQADDVQADDVQADDVQADDVVPDDVQADDVQADDVQADDVQADDVQADDVVPDDVQADDVVPDDVVPDDSEQLAKGMRNFYIPLSKRQLSVAKKFTSKCSLYELHIAVNKSGHGALIINKGNMLIFRQNHFSLDDNTVFYRVIRDENIELFAGKHDSSIIFNQKTEKFVLSDTIISYELDTEIDSFDLSKYSNYIGDFVTDKTELFIAENNVNTVIDCLVCNKDITRLDFTGFFVSKENFIVSTDGHRLNVIKPSDNTFSIVGELTYNPIVLPEVLNIGKALKTYVSLNFSSNHKTIGRYSDNTIAIINNIDERFPDFTKVIPSESKTSLAINLDQFESMIKRLPWENKKQCNTLRISCLNDLSCRIGNWNKIPGKIYTFDKRDAVFSSSVEEFGLDPFYTLDAIHAMSHFKDFAEMRIVDKNSPVFMESDELSVVIMPKQI